MRIVAGQLGGRNFDSPHSQRTHPMSERIRGALFNTLGDIVDLTVLDAFAGTGAIGFEAISRGAATAVLIENDANAQRIITRNIKQLDLTDCVRLIKSGCLGWSDNNPSTSFDLVIVDPPFDELQPAAVNRMAEHVQPGGLYIVNWPGHNPLPELPVSLSLAAHKTFGDAQLAFYRREA